MEVQTSTTLAGGAEKTTNEIGAPQPRRPGRPATYIFDKPDHELTEEDRKLRNAVLKRRMRQNRSYYRRKMKKKAGGQEASTVHDSQEVAANDNLDSSLDLMLPQGGQEQEDPIEEIVTAGANGSSEPVDLVDVITRAETSQGAKFENPEELGEDLEECLMMAVKGTMDRSTSLSHSAGVKDILFNNLRERFHRLPDSAQGALKSLAIFPRDFDMASAAAVMGEGTTGELNSAIDLIQPLFGMGFITSSNDRFELNNVTKMFLTEEPNFHDELILGSNRGSESSMKRYTQHFQKLLVELTNPSIHKLGFARERAMQVFDVERENMNYSLELCRMAGPERLREFLAAGAAVMRYCVDASTRIHYLQEALTLAGMQSNASAVSSSQFDSELPPDRRNVVRLELARAEALCDNQSLEDAEEPLKKAMVLMDCDFTKSFTGVMDTVLVLLLLASVKINLSKTDEGHKLLVEALKILNKNGLGKTTLAVNALTNLVTVYVRRGQNDMANYVASELLNTLHTMRYDKMPIYADALGVLAMVRMACGDYADAARQFGTGLEIVAGWGSKQWTSVPVQHCLDLDIWLMEGLTICLNLQGCEKDASYMAGLAADARLSRGLRPLSYELLGGEEVVPLWLGTSRHLY
mmetsp:Transcript_5123/g.15324  ORF Transcript_5123/g.15324 Transcript_5123/m.15324 type:complete len:637 (+) Transcript_5123:336-2246(+)